LKKADSILAFANRKPDETRRGVFKKKRGEEEKKNYDLWVRGSIPGSAALL